LRRSDPPSKESYRLCKNDYETEKEARVEQKGCRTTDVRMSEQVNKYKMCMYCDMQTHCHVTAVQTGDSTTAVAREQRLIVQLWLSQLRIAVVRSEKLVGDAGDS
jgi:hypothetical protein